jgi:uncharacterized membrane protein (Fun14 family)
MVVEAATQNVTSLTPFLTTVGFGGLVGYLIGIAIRYIVKIIAIIVGLLLAATVFAITMYS